MDETLNNHKMSTKIEGWANPEHIKEPHPFVFQRDRLGGSTEVACTLVIHDGKPERVYTASEVKALVQDLYNAAMDGPYLPNCKRMDECLLMHGINLS